jgi:ankyrin repeat protein
MPPQNDAAACFALLPPYSEGRVEVLKLLLNHLSPDDRMEATNAKDGNGLTPLFLVGTRGCDSPECLKVLISVWARLLL